MWEGGVAHKMRVLVASDTTGTGVWTRGHMLNLERVDGWIFMDWAGQLQN